MRMRVAILAALACAAIAGPAQAACPWPASYPGDAAAKNQLAQWMAGGSAAAGLPAELPVMGALVESGLTNLNYGDADTAGYFGMRKAVWDTGKYAGFLDHPELQLQWFVDQAQVARAKRIALGQQDPVLVESVWGDWIADVLLPAAQYRYRYQLQLANARALVGPACPAGGPPPPGGGMQEPPAPVSADTVGPVVQVAGARSQRALHLGAVLVQARCPAEACAASATATIAVPGAKRALRLTSRKRAIAAGGTQTLRLVLNAKARAAVRRALRAHRVLTAKVRIAVADAAGNLTIAGRTVRLTG
jgi:hypothetical protein